MKNMSEELRSIPPPPEIIPDQSLWYKGPDGKFYATEEGLRAAEEDFLRQKPPKKIIMKNKIPNLINPNEATPPESILNENLIGPLTQMTPEQIKALARFLDSLPLPPTTAKE